MEVALASTDAFTPRIFVDGSACVMEAALSSKYLTRILNSESEGVLCPERTYGNACNDDSVG